MSKHEVIVSGSLFHGLGHMARGGSSYAHPMSWAQMLSLHSGQASGSSRPLAGLGDTKVWDGDNVLVFTNDDAYRDFINGLPGSDMNDGQPLEASGDLYDKFQRAYAAAKIQARAGGVRSAASVSQAEQEISTWIAAVSKFQQWNNAGAALNVLTSGLAMQKGRTKAQDDAYRDAIWHLRDRMYAWTGTLAANAAADKIDADKALAVKAAAQSAAAAQGIGPGQAGSGTSSSSSAATAAQPTSKLPIYLGVGAVVLVLGAVVFKKTRKGGA
ncbi:MAG: hypothetical protein KGI71_05065 [Patescibacteria group bacterium]|nr:hypothetical protein [Patescibacteria group bacterium]